MTKVSTNPRRYSRGPDGLDPQMPLHVHMRVTIAPADLAITIARLEQLLAEHPLAVCDLAAQRRHEGRIQLTLRVNMGPAHDALRGISEQTTAGYRLLWAITKTLYYARPVFCPPPTLEEAGSVNQMNEQAPANATRRPESLSA